jgi:hypothetical protein
VPKFRNGEDFVEKVGERRGICVTSQEEAGCPAAAKPLSFGRLWMFEGVSAPFVLRNRLRSAVWRRQAD